MPPSPLWREAGLASNLSHTGEGARQSESQTKPRETSDSIRVSSQDPPSVKSTSTHFEPHASSYREPVRKPSCVFCSGRTHRSAKCHNYRSLAGRAYAAEFNQFCCNCLCDHFGDCIWTDGCTYCRLPGHHPAFCVKNPYVDLDIGMPAPQFYQELARRTYQAPPPGRICKTLSDVVRRRGSKRPSRSTSPSTSKGKSRH
ncbi:hypothetical protein RB195_021541 [Necator americanus]|uniref:Uncharacterized protein n=1 Tax=Necator americanus TaxID=51031 RepID=A0ABR1EBV0_NECAM